jgi:hypothetical protein
MTSGGCARPVATAHSCSRQRALNAASEWLRGHADGRCGAVGGGSEDTGDGKLRNPAVCRWGSAGLIDRVALKRLAEDHLHPIS